MGLDQIKWFIWLLSKAEVKFKIHLPRMNITLSVEIYARFTVAHI